MSAYTLGIDLGGSSVKAVTILTDGRILSKTTLPFEQDQPRHWACQIRDLISRIDAEQGSPAAHIGLSAPGLAAHDGRSIAFMPGRLRGLEGLDWTGFLSRAEPVAVLNDAHAALFGEARLGAAAGLRNVIMLTLGTGVGGAAIVDGRLLRGHLGRAGHLGHICLNPQGDPGITGLPGSLEQMIGNCSIHQRTGGRFRSTHDLVAAYRAGEVEARQFWLPSVRALACAVASFINILDPEAVVIGGGIARAGEALFRPLQEFLDPIEWRPGGRPVKLLPARLGEFAGALGAACHARETRNL